MGLAPSEQRALALIEDSLRRSDPRLAAMMATFGVLVTRRRIRCWTCVSPWRLQARRMVLAALVLASVGLLILGVLLASHSGAHGGLVGPCGVGIRPAGRC